ncbi:MAG: DUF1080 domain-containing protein [Phycisphaera sp.]|nr:DUF1080 domain-containing protein [Phycisphaera sp.]
MRIAVIVTVLLALVAPVRAADKPNYGPDAEFPAGKWVDLFNGKDLDGWIVKIRYHDLNDNYKDTFRVVDGLMTVSYDGYDGFNETYGHIFYKRPFSHYRLRVEYRFIGEQCKGGAGWAWRNNGAMLHCQDPASMPKDQSYPVSIEGQLLGGRGNGQQRPTANLCTPGTNVVRDGKLWTPHCVNSTSKTYDGDQWVTCEFEVNGSKSIKHIIDGQTVLEYTNPQYDPNDATAKPLIKDPNNLLIEGGYISFQSESHPTQFRKIQVMVLEEK